MKDGLNFDFKTIFPATNMVIEHYEKKDNNDMMILTFLPILLFLEIFILPFKLLGWIIYMMIKNIR